MTSEESPSTKFQLNSLCDLIDSHILQGLSGQNACDADLVRARMLALILAVWARCDFSLCKLENFVLNKDRAGTLIPLLGCIINAPANLNIDGDVVCNASLRLSRQLAKRFRVQALLLIVGARARLAAQVARNGTSQLATEQLRASVVGNMLRSVEADQTLIINSLPYDIVQEGCQRILAFSCGHAFRQRIFVTDIMPQFEQRMGVVCATVPRVIPFIAAQYQRMLLPTGDESQRLCHLPCPVCVVTELREMRTKNNSSRQVSDRTSCISNSATEK